MRYILNLLEKITPCQPCRNNNNNDDDDSDGTSASLAVIYDDMLQSVTQRISSSYVAKANKKCGTTANLYCFRPKETKLSAAKNSRVGGRRCYCVVGKDTPLHKANSCVLMVPVTKKKMQLEQSVFKTVGTILGQDKQGTGETITESVTRKVAERKSEIQHLTRPQTVMLMRLKYNLRTKSGPSDTYKVSLP